MAKGFLEIVVIGRTEYWEPLQHVRLHSCKNLRRHASGYQNTRRRRLGTKYTLDPFASTYLIGTPSL